MSFIIGYNSDSQRAHIVHLVGLYNHLRIPETQGTISGVYNTKIINPFSLTGWKDHHSCITLINNDEPERTFNFFDRLKFDIRPLTLDEHYHLESASKWNHIQEHNYKIIIDETNTGSA
jgi:hypothetical protein